MTAQTLQKTLPLPLSAKARRTREQPISFLIETAIANPRLINLAAGLVDPLTLPVDECREISARIFGSASRARSALQYDTTVGLRALRQKLAEHLAALEGISVAELGFGAEQIVTTTGSQQALYLVGDALIDPGDIVIAANPSYFVYTGTLQSLGASVLTVPMDDDGMDVDAVERLLAEIAGRGDLPRVKLIYVTTYFDNPTGLSLSPQRRRQLLEIVRSYADRQRIVIHEDAAYRELRYDGPAMPSIKSLDVENRHTILSLTFSKPFAPGLKLGYSAMPDDLLHAVLQQKGNHDFGSANLAQHIALEALSDGSYDAHVQVLVDAYRRKRDAMLAALRKWMPPRDDLYWTHPHGGLYVWLTLPKGIDTARESALFKAAVAGGVLYVPGVYCHQPDERGVTPSHHIRLSFGQVDPAQIDPGIERLGKAISMRLAGQ